MFKKLLKLINIKNLEIPPNLTNQFNNEITFANFKKNRIVIIAILLASFFLISADYSNWRHSLWIIFPGYRYLFYSHIILFFLLLISLFFSFKFNIKNSNEIKKIHKIHSSMVLNFLLIISSITSVIDQMLTGEITVFIIGCFTFAMLNYKKFKFNLISYGISSLILFFGIFKFQTDLNVIKTHSLNIILVSIVCLALSSFLFKNKMKDFINEDQLKEINELLTEERNKYKLMSTIDGLTGLKNFTEIIRIGELILNDNKNLAVLIIDLDNFKQFNDMFGHLIGNNVLIEISDFLKKSFESIDSIIGRLGGDEFVVLVPEYNMHKLNQIIKELNNKFITLDSESYLSTIKVSLSIGISFNTSDEYQDIKELLQKADMDMYLNKYKRQQQSNEDSNLSILPEGSKQLLKILSEKDIYTYIHSQCTAKYAMNLGKKINLPEETVNNLYIAGWLHDVGKIIISRDIIRKPTKLTEQEYEIIKKHVLNGIKLLSDLNLPKEVLDAIKTHHEKWDGTGYPNNLSKYEIPQMGRILQISDSFSAMTTKRLYREKPLSINEALNEIKKNKGIQFDPELAESFIDLFGDDFIEK